MNDIQTINKAADNIRILAASMVEKAKSGHPGGAMGGADFINVLFSEFLVFDPDNPAWINRDRFFLDPGHMSPMLYATLSLCGKYTMDELQQFRQWGSATPGHPEVDVERGVENTSGPLGQGHAMGIGSAIAERFLASRFGEWMAHKTYGFISDGGVQEEISQGAGRLAGHLGLSNFILFYDSNDIQLSTETNAVTSEDTAKKYEAWGWLVLTINGNDAQEIRDALTKANAETTRPTLIIGKTIMGKGAVAADKSSFERKTATHGMPLGECGASFPETIKNLGGDPENPFRIFPESTALYQKRAQELRAILKVKKEEQAAWEKDNAGLAVKLKAFFSNELPDIDYAAIPSKFEATRATSATVLGVLAQNFENMIVATADLANSDKTDGFLKYTKAFARQDFSGAFLHAGVCELTMATIMNGIALHGGIHCACGTFFVFSDYMKPAIRLAALQQLPVKYIWTHDAFRVGEDGPTHQPIEQEAQIRLLEQLKNHKGENSMLVLRPADSVEAIVAWKMAVENTKTPTGLIFTRQNVKNLPAASGNRYQEALSAKEGAYIVQKAANPDVVLVASGSEVGTLVDVAALLEERDALKVQVVSAPSEGLFFNQPLSYQQEVIPNEVPVFGLTAGLPSTLFRLVGKNGTVQGLDHFGYSAPFSVLEEKFGYTAETVYKNVIAFIKK